MKPFERVWQLKAAAPWDNTLAYFAAVKNHVERRWASQIFFSGNFCPLRGALGGARRSLERTSICDPHPPTPNLDPTDMAGHSWTEQGQDRTRQGQGQDRETETGKGRGALGGVLGGRAKGRSRTGVLGGTPRRQLYRRTKAALAGTPGGALAAH